MSAETERAISLECARGNPNYRWFSGMFGRAKPRSPGNVPSSFGCQNGFCRQAQLLLFLPRWSTHKLYTRRIWNGFKADADLADHVTPYRSPLHTYLGKPAHRHPHTLSSYGQDHVNLDIVVPAAVFAPHAARQFIHVGIAKKPYEVAGLIVAPAVAIVAIAAVYP
ncbi:hypothetical protein [Mesorhizobium sp.]|uniref:hypothetical protein n=1 Tax=Mesorhizobium sp. TaxID=1871066 RepID=UPI0025F4D9DC|nr:hypothetical protein [Mesorhizobium sp.]